MNKVTVLSLIVFISVFLSSCESENKSILSFFNVQTFRWSPSASETDMVIKVANEVESAADKLSTHSFTRFKPLTAPEDTDTQSCIINNTAVITIYSTNSVAQTKIDVLLDGSHIGSLTTYFPTDEPDCKTPSTEGIITLLIPAGNHVLEAASPNLTWPSHAFSVDKCQCLVLPLS